MIVVITYDGLWIRVLVCFMQTGATFALVFVSLDNLAYKQQIKAYILGKELQLNVYAYKITEFPPKTTLVNRSPMHPIIYPVRFELTCFKKAADFQTYPTLQQKSQDMN